MSDEVKLIAFYLPQFHTIPENDKWWGEGFTEWTNVRKAKPLFDGHYQPHVPHSDIGYYNLRNIETQKQQAKTAQKYGIYGFCYYHYWFGGKKLLETPLQNVLQHPEIDLPFCICWANENWTRKWDGAEKKILIAQKHSPEDDLAFIKDVMPALKDSRYIFVDGKPLLVVYRPALFPDFKETAKIWRAEVKKNGFPGLHIARVENFDNGVAPEKFGCDINIDFSPDFDLGESIRSKKPATFSYDDLVVRKLSKIRPYSFVQSVCPSWDNAARRQDGGGFTFVHSSPEKYEYWLKHSIKKTLIEGGRSDHNMIFINAWNEWGEGAHLEPDEKYGYAYLEATKKAIHDAQMEVKSGFVLEQKIFKEFGSLLLERGKNLDEIARLSYVLEQREQELNLMRSSKFWKMREAWEGVKWLVRNPLKWTKKHILK